MQHCHRRRHRQGRHHSDRDGMERHRLGGDGSGHCCPGREGRGRERFGQDRAPRRLIALVGNPNTGKSVIFHYLTRRYVEVSNYPGTTVEVTSGWSGEDLVVDTPGVYGISGLNDEERVTRDAVLQADLVINVVDAAHLSRDLFLTLQLCDLGVPMVVCLNMVDEARTEGKWPDPRVLEEALGVPVIPTVATRRQGLPELRAALARAVPGRPDPDLAARLAREIPPDVVGQVEDDGRGRALTYLYLEGDDLAARRLGLPPGGNREAVWARRRRRADELAARAVTGGSVRGTERWRGMVDHLLTWPASGLLVLVLILALAYWFLGVVVAGTVVDFLEGTVMQGYWEPAVRGLVGHVVPPRSAVGQLLAGEFGLLTMTVTYIVGLLLPLVVGFYLLMGFLEDSGYMPRVAVLFDRALNPLGLNGRAVIPFMLGFGCVTMAIVSTRVLNTSRERRIAIILLSLAIPCSAQLGVVTGMITPLGWRVLAFYGATVFTVFALAGMLLDRLLPGTSSPLLMDLPPLRIPRLDNLLYKTAYRAITFIREAGPLFFYGAAGLGVLQVTGALDHLQDLLAPVVTGWLGLPREAATAFVMGFVRRDFGAAGLYHLGLGAVQTLVAVVTITLFVPCVASVMMIGKERGWKEVALIWAGNIVLAFGVGGVVARLAPLVVR
ncbi:MAG: ferrous iron transport protein B [Bacillota bacterium]